MRCSETTEPCRLLTARARLPPTGVVVYPLMALLFAAPGAGAQHFATSTLLCHAGRTASVALCDLDGNGDLDLVLGNGRHDPETNWVYSNDGHGNFYGRRALDEEPDRTCRAALGDVDKDGDLDLVVVSNVFGQNFVYLYDGGKLVERKFGSGRESSVGAVNTRIGDIAPPEQLMKTLTDRKLAEQERITYGTQREAEEVRKSLQQATAQADTQPGVVRAERDVDIAEFNAKASVKKAEGDATSKTINADADARVTQLNGDAEAGKIRAIGTSEADVIKLKIASMESRNYALIETARALAGSGFKLVPDIVAGGDGGQGGSLVSVLLANLVAENVRKNAEERPAAIARSGHQSTDVPTGEGPPSLPE